MASIGHIAVGMAAARAYSREPVSAAAIIGAMVFWSALSLAPDADVIGLKLGIPYHAPRNPIPVAPIGRRFFTATGMRVALAELVMFAPLIAYALWPRARAASPSHAVPARDAAIDQVRQGEEE